MDDLKMMTDCFHVPKPEIYRALAISNRSNFKFMDESLNLFNAGDYNESHRCLLYHCAPKAIVHGHDIDRFREALGKLNEVKSNILDWNTGGAIYLAYIDLCQMIDADLFNGNGNDLLNFLSDRIGGLSYHGELSTSVEEGDLNYRIFQTSKITMQTLVSKLKPIDELMDDSITKVRKVINMEQTHAQKRNILDQLNVKLLSSVDPLVVMSR